MNLSYLAKILSIWTITVVFAFLINNYLTYAGDWPGPLSFYNSFNIFNLTQLLIYLVAILFPLLFLNLYGNNYKPNLIMYPFIPSNISANSDRL